MSELRKLKPWHSAVLLFMISLVMISILVLATSYAEELTVGVDNSPPSVVAGTQKICDNETTIPSNDAAISACANLANITPTAGDVRALSFFVKVRDMNGNANIPVFGNHVVTLYHSIDAVPADETCTADDNSCYRLTCTKEVDIAVGGNTDAWLRCDFNLNYYTNPSELAGEWVGHIHTEDSSGGSVENSSYTVEVPKIVSGTFPVIDFGNRQNGTSADAGNNIEIQHQNTGNTTIDLRLSIDDDDSNAALDCDSGVFAVSNIRFDTVDSGFSGASHDVTVEPTTIDFDIDIPPRSNDAAPVINDDTGDIQRSYWSISVPSNNTATGFCQEGLNVTVFEAP